MAKSNVDKKPISEAEYTTNKVLTVFTVCLLGVLVLMVLQRLLDYSSTWRFGQLMTKALLGIGIVGVLYAAYLFSREVSGKRDAARRLLCGRNVLIVSAVVVITMAVIQYFGPWPIKILYVILPVLAVYYLIYHSYAPEFFVIAADSGLALGLIWAAHRALSSTSHAYLANAALGLMAAVAVIQLICAWTLKGKKGKFKFRGKTVDSHFSRNAYTMLAVTPVLMTVLVAVTLFAQVSVLVTLGVCAAYLFITAVYYTVKLM